MSPPDEQSRQDRADLRQDARQDARADVRETHATMEQQDRQDAHQDERQDARQDARAEERNENGNSDTIAAGISQGVKESRLKLTDNRMLVLYAIIVAFVAVSTIWQNNQTDKLRHTQRANYALCLSLKQGHQSFNALLDQAARNITANKAYTAEQKAQAVKFYEAAHLPVLVCTGLAP
jgi:hypothetical protein